VEIKHHIPQQSMGQRSNHTEIKKYFETNENGNIAHQNIWVAAKAVLKGNFKAINTYINKEGISNI
jgi:hypothetical protein